MNLSFENQQVRAIESNGEIWWILKDVCDVLGLTDTNRTAERLDDDELTRFKLVSGGQSREMIVINESGLYSVILRSDKPQAKAFRRWITHEVLPQIRRTGCYSRVRIYDIFNDSELTVQAKLIFMYLCSCADGKDEYVINRA